MRTPAVLTAGRRLMAWLAAGLLLALTGLTFAQVLARYVFSFSMPWSEELLRLLFVWMVLVGAASCDHIRLDAIDARLPVAGRRALGLFAAAFALVMLGLLMLKGVGLIRLTAFDRYTALPLSVQWLYWPLLVGGGLWALFLVIDAIWPRPAEPPAL